MNPEDLAAYLEVVKTFVEPGVQLVFYSTVRSVYVKNLVALVVMIPTLVAGLVASGFCFYKETTLSHHSSDKWAPFAVGFIILVLTVLVALCVLPETIGNVVVPEARAIQILLR